MTVIDVEEYLEPVSDESPAGDNFEDDLAFLELEQAARGKEERRVGAIVVPAEPPDWKAVLRASRELLARTRDLRIAVRFTEAALNVHGLQGFVDGLKLLHGLIDRFWDTVHPLPDPEDGDRPLARINALIELNDRTRVVRSLLMTPIVASRAAGRFSMRDVLIAKGELTPVTNGQTPSLELIEAAFLDCDLDELKATAGAAREAVSLLSGIAASLNEKLKSHAPSLKVLADELQRIVQTVDGALERRGARVESTGNDAEGDAPAAEAPSQVVVGAIRSREDAARMLDQVAEYFRKNEPSSPVPLLIERARRLISKDFIEILRELAPDGVPQAELVSGLNREQ